MPLAMINVRLDAALKERVDSKLQQLGYSATQAITALYQYIDQNDSLPFTIETRVYRPRGRTSAALRAVFAQRSLPGTGALPQHPGRCAEQLCA